MLLIICSISSAMDARLDFAVDCHAEVSIRRLTMLGACNLAHSVNSVFPPVTDADKVPLFPSVWPQPDNEPLTSHNMLIACFDRIFCELQLQVRIAARPFSVVLTIAERWLHYVSLLLIFICFAGLLDKFGASISAMVDAEL